MNETTSVLGIAKKLRQDIKALRAKAKEATEVLPLYQKVIDAIGEKGTITIHSRSAYATISAKKAAEGTTWLRKFHRAGWRRLEGKLEAVHTSEGLEWTLYRADRDKDKYPHELPRLYFTLKLLSEGGACKRVVTGTEYVPGYTNEKFQWECPPE